MEGWRDGRTDGRREGGKEGRREGRREGGKREGASTLTTLSDLGQRSEKYQKDGNKIRKENMGIMTL